jgi:hypothetical protein
VRAKPMNEEQWLICTDPSPMLEFLRGRGSDRKLRLFAVACCRNIRHLLTDERSWNAVEVAERFADGTAEDAELSAATLGMEFSPASPEAAAFLASVRRFDRPSALFRYGIVDLARFDEEAARRVESICSSGFQFPADAALAVARKAVTDDGPAEGPIQADCLRCIFGPLPFRELRIDPAWRTRTVTAIARSAYEERDFTMLPILADALEDEGCESEEVLAHCRQQGGAHVRGCWVLDFLLRKQ